MWVLDIYPAGEAPIPGITSEALVQSIREHGHHAVRAVPERAGVADALYAIVEPGDIVIALGAGDINKSIKELYERLERDGLPAKDRRVPASKGPSA